ncbi:Alpha/Beta hydrolase protein [Melampsora americana]|nr:Alpha/Beta hydrolase protein [Melampsora americana]
MFISPFFIIASQLLLRSTAAQDASIQTASDQTGHKNASSHDNKLKSTAPVNGISNHTKPVHGSANTTALFNVTESGDDSKNITKPIAVNTTLRVVLDYGDFTGKVEGALAIWSGVPFAEAPIGERRFANPIPPTKNFTKFDASKRSPGCPTTDPFAGADEKNFNTTVLEVLSPLTKYLSLNSSRDPGQEDCLTLDIIKPSGIGKNPKLPVIFYIPSQHSNEVNPAGLMARGKMNNQTFIWVAANWRSNAFGFLGGKELAAANAGNLGLKDQRLALEWVHRYIHHFGGDHRQVTLYGSDTGAKAVSHHLVAFNGQHKKLFNAAIIDGSVALPSPKMEEGQATYDKFVKAAGCPVGEGSLACLRKAEFKRLVAAANTFPGVFSRGKFPLPFHAYVDGKFLTGSIDESIKAGKVAKVPIMVGSAEDSGTLGTLVEASHIFNETGVTAWLRKLLPGAKPQEVTKLMTFYPSNPAQGSPFDTGAKNALNPVSKQIAAIFGDLAFQGMRRFFSRSVQASTPVFGFIDRGLKNTSYLGSFEGATTISILKAPTPGRSEAIQSRFLSFVYTQNPNTNSSKVQWPKYGETGQLLQFDDEGASKAISDDFRKSAIEYYIQNIMGDSAKMGNSTHMSDHANNTSGGNSTHSHNSTVVVRPAVNTILPSNVTDKDTLPANGTHQQHHRRLNLSL